MATKIEAIKAYCPQIDLNKKNAFRGRVANAEYIGKSADDLVAQWNKDHPDDPVA